MSSRIVPPGSAASLALLCMTLAYPARAEPLDAACRPEAHLAEAIESPTLKVLTLNLAHGRKGALNQMLVTGRRHRGNLDDVSNILSGTDAVVVGLQEADAPSLWSGRFDHVDYVAGAANYGCYLHGRHADTWLYEFGSALLTNVRMRDTRSHSFRPSWPTTTKGVVSGTVDWFPDGASGGARAVTFVSLHLDFSSRKVRESQIQELIENFGDIDTPFIIMGDFNAEWSGNGSPLREIAEQYRLKAYQPLADDFHTYKGRKRLDWVLISEELEFVSYSVISDVVSDHLAVVAEIAWATEY